MNKKVGIKFKATGKVYDFDSGAFVLNRGDHVIVETEQGLGFGTVAVDPVLYQRKKGDRPLKKIYRLANKKDFKQLSKVTLYSFLAILLISISLGVIGFMQGTSTIHKYLTTIAF